MVESGLVGPQDQKTGAIGSNWPQIGFKFGLNPIIYLINPNEPYLNLISGRFGPPGSKFGLSRVGFGPPRSKLESSWVGLVGFIWTHCNSIEFRIHEKKKLLFSSIIVNSIRVSTLELSIFIFIHILTERFHETPIYNLGNSGFVKS